MTAIPYLTVHDAAAALEFYAAAFGATVGERYDEPDGRIGFAALTVAGAPVFVSDEVPELGAVSPRTAGCSTVGVVLQVDDVERVYAAALAAGATSDRPPSPGPAGLSAWLVDPFGHRWNLVG